MQANQTPVIWTTIISALVILIAGFFMFGSINSNLDVAMANLPTTASIAALITIPTAAQIAAEIPTANVDTLNKLCDRTDGCDYYEGSISWLSNLDDDDAWDDFLDELEDIADIDNEDLGYDYDMKDWQVRTYSKQDKKDGNWEVQVFVKITYWDVDDVDDREKIYLLITSVLDEGDYESMSVKEVSRNFEFD